MAINKDSNGYTFGFAIAMVIVVGTALSLLAIGLKPYRDANGIQKKQLEILSAFLDLDAEKISRKNVAEKFDEYVNLDEAVVLDRNGKIKEGVNAFDIDVQVEYKDKKLKDEDKNYPLFVAKKDGKKLYVMPIVGKGLWGPIWGNICLGEDMNTIEGASFGHKGETPGLGAEIAQKFFIDRWIGEKLSDDSGVFTKFEIVKDGSGAATEKKVDGITGGTITSKGVEEMANRCLAVYATYFNNLKN
ncbi:MAG: NADH:ubiquinone reductase (Na(+)-transporting) subunit C [Crocinitomicaceae bacterium]